MPGAPAPPLQPTRGHVARAQLHDQAVAERTHPRPAGPRPEAVQHRRVGKLRAHQPGKAVRGPVARHPVQDLPGHGGGEPGGGGQQVERRPADRVGGIQKARPGAAQRRHQRVGAALVQAGARFDQVVAHAARERGVGGGEAESQVVAHGRGGEGGRRRGRVRRAARVRQGFRRRGCPTRFAGGQPPGRNVVIVPGRGRRS